MILNKRNDSEQAKWFWISKMITNERNDFETQNHFAKWYRASEMISSGVTRRFHFGASGRNKGKDASISNRKQILFLANEIIYFKQMFA